MNLVMILPVYLIITFFGEIIDRSEFYYESDITTPEKELRIDSISYGHNMSCPNKKQ